ncbi:hypothetical protein E3N88_40288 [Mikania micrantha]|uniref:Uncharacterized protein n=1 Tax=Mikania micrantha TaxID=192012 RepID=A0A5N6LN23_9ASTR|nr:hypothetical protein E3N88_40288 [Mikania micrantha]
MKDEKQEIARGNEKGKTITIIMSHVHTPYAIFFIIAFAHKLVITNCMGGFGEGQIPTSIQAPVLGQTTTMVDAINAGKALHMSTQKSPSQSTSIPVTNDNGCTKQLNVTGDVDIIDDGVVAVASGEEVEVQILLQITHNTHGLLPRNIYNIGEIPTIHHSGHLGLLKDNDPALLHTQPCSGPIQITQKEHELLDHDPTNPLQPPHIH